MDDLLNIVRREVFRVLATVQQGRSGEVTSYDPDKHAVKVRLQPDGVITDWIPIETSHTGNGFGVLAAPQIGDQVKIGFQEGDLDTPRITGRIHSDEQKPPRLEAGEMLHKHASGSTVFFDKDGNVHIKSSGNVFINGSGSTP